jgi:hypothetical protein
MAIDRIPGVGPQNTDIATAVAAAVPTIAAITSSITANAASAGVTIAAITSAGNSAGWGATGPTTTQIAAAVPTLAQINTSVATNAPSPYGVTWVNLALTTTNGVSGVTISSLSGYKYYRVLVLCESMSGSNKLSMRFNGDTGANYGFAMGSASPSGEIARFSTQATLSPQLNGSKGAMIDIPAANLTSGDKMFFTLGAVSSVGASGLAVGVWQNTAAITSMTFFDSQSNTGNWYVRVMGAN